MLARSAESTVSGLSESTTRLPSYPRPAILLVVLAIFYTKVYDRLLRPLIAADQPPAPAELRNALKTIERHVHDYITKACLRYAA